MRQPLRFDYANCLQERVGDQGIERSAIDRAAAYLAEITERLNAARNTGSHRFRSLPVDPLRGKHIAAVRHLAEKLRPQTRNLLVLGIGGSALGTIALQGALKPATYNLMPPEARGGPRLFVLDNVDPHFVGETLDEIRREDPRFEGTLVTVISKSGETAETAAQFLLVRAMLAEALGDDHPRHIVAITDPRRGTMRSICESEGYATLPVPDGVGGRFSVLSPVGLFPACMCGIDIDALLDGAQAMDERSQEPAADRNPAAMLAWLLIELARRGKDQHVLMPYANALYPLADWFRQLWAESLGKRVDRKGREVLCGPTPIKALGATDQHSQIQLYREGPNNKVIGFVDLQTQPRDHEIPGGPEADAMAYLQGSTLGDLLAAEKRATEYALVESKRPNFSITLPRLDAHCVGQFIQLWEVTTAFAGELLDINAFDQPAVETGKAATFGLMGREGYEKYRALVEEKLG